MLGYWDKIISGEVDSYKYMRRRFSKLLPYVLTSTIVTAVLQYIYYAYNGAIMQYPTELFTVDYFILNILSMQNGIIGRGFSFNGPLWFVSNLFVNYILFSL